uniref:Uncharacterized protein n=1 Tax=Pipistrellus kuhlii TaxID=59472 RepID=A0A7J7XV54_PIPKU|nr:hypothetical protein mPipKuh1_010440 [Pipistrellus kuhlii]
MPFALQNAGRVSPGCSLSLTLEFLPFSPRPPPGTWAGPADFPARIGSGLQSGAVRSAARPRLGGERSPRRRLQAGLGARFPARAPGWFLFTAAITGNLCPPPPLPFIVASGSDVWFANIIERK